MFSVEGGEFYLKEIPWYAFFERICVVEGGGCYLKEIPWYAFVESICF